MNFKGNISIFIRKAGLIQSANIAKFIWEYLKHFISNQKYKAEMKGIKFPPAYMMFESFNMNFRKYYEGGLNTGKWILSKLVQYRNPENLTVLDWGCGPARITRHLPDLLPRDCSIYGTDYNKNTINWCKQNIRNVHFSLNNVDPPLLYEDEKFDIIVGISIFTHLSEANHNTFVKELSRILKKNGLLYITTHGRVFKTILTDDERFIFESNNIVVRDGVKEGHRVFTSFQPDIWLRTIFEKYFHIMEHYEGKKAVWGLEQDYWILKKL